MDTDGEKSPAITRLSTAHSRELGEELRRIRRTARLSSAVVAESLGWSLGKLSKLETGNRGTSPWGIATLLGRCVADEATRDRVMAIAHEPDTGTFTRTHHGSPDTLTALTLHEHLAHSVTAYEPLTVPALAQTTAYAGALTGDQNLAATRVARQDRLLYRRTPPNATLYVHETALRLVVGNRAAMRDQLLYLTLQAGLPHITVHVIPITAPAHPALRHHAALFTFAPPLRPLSYSENGITTVFHDNLHAVEHHQRRLRELHARALPAAQSGEVIAHWADAYDKGIR
ncbi:helix-turn-helix transcriptional regulator [Actinosynnema sp. NPDC023658]|uniref:helix-turn-helix domain-containing protein n=1 Tax=Actinosynnema sp. NPDC023658 TaxID=3155465 RepID=UPI0033D9B904